MQTNQNNMLNIDQSRVHAWTEHNGKHIPFSVSLRCPHCSAQVIFKLESHVQYTQGGFYAVNSTSKCPGCLTSTLFVVVSPKAKAEPEKGYDAFYVYPAPSMPKEADIDDLSELPGAIIRDIKSIYNTYNIQEWNATAVCSRRVMEGLMLHILKEDAANKTLDKQLKLLPEKMDLGKPILELSNAMRLFGNWGAHFNDVAPTKEIADQMLESIEFILEYIFVLPHKVEKFKKHIEEGKKKPKKADAEDVTELSNE